MKLTQKDFCLFKVECQRWIKKLGLTSWTVYYHFKPQEDGEIASCTCLYADRVATISLATSFVSGGTSKGQILKDTALHEALEILMSPLLYLASERNWDENTYTKEHHVAIRAVQNVLMETK